MLKPLGSRWLLLLVMFLRAEEVEFLAQKILAGQEWKLLCHMCRTGHGPQPLPRKMLKIFLMQGVVMEIGAGQLQSSPLISSGCGSSQG